MFSTAFSKELGLLNGALAGCLAGLLVYLMQMIFFSLQENLTEKKLKELSLVNDYSS